MKKRLVMLLAGLLTVLSMGFGLAQFSDVPAGHWAKEAVEAVAARGLITGFPDGTFRGNEGLTRYQAALIIYRLLQQIEEELKAKGESPTLEAISSEDLEVLRNAVQELAAELAALGVRVSALEDSVATKEDIARLEAMIEQLKAMPMPEPGVDPAALQDLADRVEAASIAADTALAQAQQLAEQLDALAQEVEGVKGDLAALATRVEANAQAIQALNELAILLNQDVLSLQDRVTALEKGLASLQEVDFEQFASKEDVAAVQEFAAALRSDLVGLSERVSRLEGTLGDLSGKVSRLERNALTVSGSLTLEYRSRDANNFTGYDLDRVIPGTFLSAPDADGDGQTVDEADPITTLSGSTTATLSLRLQTGRLDAASSPGRANTYPGLVQFSITASWTNPAPSSSATPSVTVDRVSTTLDVARDQTLSFRFGRTVNTKFTEYVMDNERNSLGHGFVATLKGLPLGATLTAAYGERDPSTSNFDYFKALRLALAPTPGFSLGLSYAQHDVPFEEVAGVDGSLSLDPLKLSGEYFRFGTNVLGTPNVTYNEGGYLRAELGPVKLNYRGLASNANNPAGLSQDDATTPDNPFRQGQRGFTVEAGLPVLGANLGLLYNVQMDTTFGTPSASAFRTTLGLGLPAGFRLSAEATLASSTAGEWFPATYNFTGVPGPATSTDYATRLRATLSHDGAARDALVRNLNLTLQYTNRTLLGGSADALVAFADYRDLALPPFTVERVVLRYNDTDLGNPSSGQTLKGGIRGRIDLAGLPLAPSLTGELAARETQPNLSEVKYGFGIRFGQFLFERSVFEVRAAQYTSQGLQLTPTVNDADRAFDANSDHLYTTQTGTGGTLSGIYITWTYWDLSFAYGLFSTQPLLDTLGGLFGTPPSDYGRAFRIRYTVNF